MGKNGDESKHARFKRLAETEGWLDIICYAIASGSTLVDLAETYDIEFADFSHWIKDNKTRREAWERADLLRGEWLTGKTIRELRRIGTSDIRGLFNQSGGLRSPSEWPEEAALAVASIKVKELFDNLGEQVGEMKEIKFWDKTKALELIGKNQKMFTDKHEHSLTKSLEELVAGSMQEEE